MFTDIDDLYRLLPAYVRRADQDQEGTLQQLLRIPGEQAVALHRDLQRMYDGWFIETCDEWLIPYIADLLGIEPAHVAPAQQRDDGTMGIRRVLSARAATANAIAQRRRKGTLWVLEEIARDVAHWPARAVEFYRRLAVASHLDHLHLARAAIADLHSARTLADLEEPFDDRCHLSDVRRIGAAQSPGRYALPNIGLFVWRLRRYPVTRSRACCREEVGAHCFTFSALGNDAPLFRKPAAELSRPGRAGAENLPVLLSRWALESAAPSHAGRASLDPRLFGSDASFFIEAADWPKRGAMPLGPEHIIPADLSDWSYKVPKNHVAVDPELGRIAFPSSQPPRHGVMVSYGYGFAMDIGGGEYPRSALPLPAEADRLQVWANPGHGDKHFTRVADAYSDWRARRLETHATGEPVPPTLVIELMESDVYAGSFELELRPGETVAVVAAAGARPVIWLSDERAGAADAVRVRGATRSRVIFDGVLIAGRAVEVGDADMPTDPSSRQDEVLGGLCEVWIRHSTLVPGGAPEPNCNPGHPSEPSLVVDNTQTRIRIESSIVGAIQVLDNGKTREPAGIAVTDSIIDATDTDRAAIAGVQGRSAYAEINLIRSTVVGTVEAHQIRYAEDTLFTSRVDVARRQTGCMRFCHVPRGSRTPKRYECQPDGVLQQVDAALATRPPGMTPEAFDTLRSARQSAELLRVIPRFEAIRYGTPQYLRLSGCAAPEIRQGAHDQSEMGVYHDLYEPQRLSMLNDRLAEFLPASCDAAVVFAS